MLQQTLLELLGNDDILRMRREAWQKGLVRVVESCGRVAEAANQDWWKAQLCHPLMDR